MRELSHNKFNNRNDEREMDIFELEELRYQGSFKSEVDYTYGTYENLTYGSTYGIEKVYDYDDYEREWN